MQKQNFLQQLELHDTNNNPISKQKTIFAFVGNRKSGKTYVVTYLCKYLKFKYRPSYIAYPRPIPARKPKEEVRFIFNLPYGKLGIVSEGDQCDGLRADLLYLIATEQCDIIVCACRPSGPDTLQVAQNLANTHGYRLFPIYMQTIINLCPTNEKEIVAFDIATNFF